MGRSFESVRMGAKEVSARWLKASRALKKEDQVYGQKLSEMVKMHSSEGFYAFDDPLEAAIFSVLVELMKELEKRDAKSTSR
jgi:predicted secreted Zn-dependent protease